MAIPSLCNHANVEISARTWRERSPLVQLIGFVQPVTVLQDQLVYLRAALFDAAKEDVAVSEEATWHPL